jgi:hypothetical protein
MFFDKLRLKRAISVARGIKLELTIFGLYSLAGFNITVIFLSI